MVSYKTGNLLAAKGLILHATNAEGAWGAGIALNIKSRFPKSYEEYLYWCNKYSYDLVGSYVKLQPEYNNQIICLFTSGTYGARLPSMEIILANTNKAVTALIASMPYNSVINSNMFNSGLFKVPWDKTEAIINACLKARPDIQWVVYKPKGSK